MTPTTTAVPTVCRYPQVGLRFLVDSFGFTERAVCRDGDAIDHAELIWTDPTAAWRAG